MSVSKIRLCILTCTCDVSLVRLQLTMTITAVQRLKYNCVLKITNGGCVHYRVLYCNIGFLILDIDECAAERMVAVISIVVILLDRISVLVTVAGD